MVSFTKLLSAGMLVFRIAFAIPALTALGDDETSVVTAVADTIKRQPGVGRQLLRWAPDGTLVYLIGVLGTVATLPPELLLIILGDRSGEGTMGKILIQAFESWLNNPGYALGYGAAHNLFAIDPIMDNNVRVGVVYNIGSAIVGGTSENLWGFGMSCATGHAPNAADLANLVAAITTYAQKDGGRILVQRMANGFFPAHLIGRGEFRKIRKRTRDATCPAIVDLLQYANADVPTEYGYNDYLTNMRWTEQCAKA